MAASVNWRRRNRTRCRFWRAATAECVGDVELLSISGRELKRLLAESAPALRSIIGAIKEYKPPERQPTFWDKLRGRR